MARPRKAAPANYNVQTNLNVTHLAFAGVKYFKDGRYSALKSVSTLVRCIVEDWVERNGGVNVQSLDHALEILDRLGLKIERRTRTKDRGFHGTEYENEEESDKREEEELQVVESIQKEIAHIPSSMLDKAAQAVQFLNFATEEQMKKLIENKEQK